MAKWTVKYRAKNGSTESLVLEAETRKELFPMLAQRGILAISITEGVIQKKKSLSIAITGKNKQGTLLGIVVVLLCALVAIYFLLCSGSSSRLSMKVVKKEAMIETVAQTEKSKKKIVKPTPSSIAQEYNEKVKEFIKKKPETNKVFWIVPPLAPDDPDNALRTRVAQELGSLLSIEPGEAMPPFPYSFMIEDDAKAAAANGEDVGEIDNGNKSFMESLKKWKIVAKETDDDKRIEHKSKILDAQTELLAGIDEGMSVNDSIRAAYEFRKRAYEMRSTIIKTLSEFAEGEENHEDTIKSIKEMNTRLEEEGIKKINISEVLPDYEDEGEIK